MEFLRPRSPIMGIEADAAAAAAAAADDDDDDV